MKPKPLILVVDDIHTNIKIVANILNKDIYTIVFAANGRQAVEIAKNVLPDIILLDIVMPDLNGFEVCKILKNMSETRDIPIIFLSAQKTDSEDILKGFQAGGADYVTKPFNPAELNARVRTHLDLKFRTQELQKSEKALKKANDELEKINQQLRRENEERIRTEKELLRYQDKLRSMTAEQVLTEEQERRRAAVEIHESIGQLIGVVKIRLEVLKQDSEAVKLAQEIEEILQYIEQTIKDIRSVSYELSPPILYEMGLEPAIKSFIDKIYEKYELNIDFIGDNQQKYLDNPSRIHLFRSIRELIFNIIKHAKANNVKICTYRDNDEIQITIEDDGVGFDSSQLTFHPDAYSGFGLFSIRERLMHLGGDFEIHSSPGKGVWVFMSAPLGDKNDY